MQRVFRAQLPERQIAVAGDGREQVVEVVRHAARELSDSLQALRLAELRFERLALLNVLKRAFVVEQPAALVANGANVFHDPYLAPVLAIDLTLNTHYDIALRQHLQQLWAAY